MTTANTIRLAVAVFHSPSNPHALDPVVYQVGGPGGHMLAAVPIIYEKVIAPFLKSRDLILFDPRGTGFSQPALECEAGEDPGDCVRRLFEEGHNLYAYNSSSMAADLQDIRQVLGYDQWNLIGESYGTLVAQVGMHEQPEGLRSVILDAVLPLQPPPLPGGKSEYEWSLSRLFERCRADLTCNAAYPDLEIALDRAVRRLNEQPVPLSFDIDGKTQSPMLTGDGLKNQVITALYEKELIPYLPYAITAAADGSSYEFWDYTEKWMINTDKILSSGAHWAVLCGDGRIQNCDNWPIAIEQQPVRSAIPTLVLSGEFDPVTPPDYGHAVAQGLPNSVVVDFPGFGHWANGTGHACPAVIIQDFLAAPTRQPDLSCVQTISQIRFIQPETVSTIVPIISTSRLVVFAAPSDRSAAEDVASAILKHRDRICSQLQIDCQFAVSVEIYPDQASLDEHAMNPAMRGFYAISGKRKVQMVSPNIPPAQPPIPYVERVLIAVHEYTHLALNEANPDLPDWLAEGAAVYLGPHDLYDQACRQNFPLNRLPRLQTLMESYSSVPAADLFAYTLVRYITETDGRDTLNRLIRSSSDISTVLNLSTAELEQRWKNYLAEMCVPPK